MFFEIQYTVADLRPLMGKVKYDDNVISQLEAFDKKRKEKLLFLRKIGASAIRRTTYNLPLEGESYRCNAKRAFRIPTFITHKLYSNEHFTIMRDKRRGLDVVYKGFFRNTFGVINRFQWGVNLTVFRKHSPDNLIRKMSFNKLIEFLLSIPVSKPIKEEKSTKSQNPLSTIVETATIKVKKNTYKDYLNSTEPIIVFRLTTADLELIDIPRKAHLIKKYKGVGVNLYKYLFVQNNIEYFVYFIVSSPNPDRKVIEKMNLLRNCLLRFFAETVCLKKVLDYKDYLNNDRIRKFINAPICIQMKAMMKVLELNNKYCSYFLCHDEESDIKKRVIEILQHKANPNSPFGILFI